MEFLGVLIDSVRRVVSLVPEKMNLYDQQVGLTLEADANGPLAVNALESQLGKLGWFSEVLIAGRARLSRIRACIPGGGSYRHHPHKRISLSPEATADLLWWREQLQLAAAHPRFVPFWTDKLPVFCSISSDAAGDVGFGLGMGGQVYQCLWQKEVLGEYSCFQELVPILLAIAPPGGQWPHSGHQYGRS